MFHGARIGWLAATAAFTTTGALADSDGKWRDGQEAYDKVCGYCHERNVGPVITGRALTTDYIRAVVRNGNRAMPAFRESEISDATLGEVARLVSASPSGSRR